MATKTVQEKVLKAGGILMGEALMFCKDEGVWFHIPKTGEWNGYIVAQPPSGGGLEYVEKISDQEFEKRFLPKKRTRKK